MTRFLLLLLCFLSWSASAQTYVRPSKGASLYPFTGASAWSGAPVFPVGWGVAQYSQQYDWSAFDAMRIRIYATSGTNIDGLSCSALTPIQYTVSDVGPFVKFYLNSTGSGHLSVFDAAVAAGPYYQITTANSKVPIRQFKNCSIVIHVTPLPFAPANVYTSLADGGISTSVTVNVSNTCTSTRSTNTSVGTSATAVPADGGLSGRQWLRVCNSPRNSGVPIITCTSDGTTPDAGLNGVGEALEVGDCSVYPTSNTVTCISDSAATSVSGEECL